MWNALGMLAIKVDICEFETIIGFIVKFLFSAFTAIIRVLGLFADLLNIAFYIFAGVDMGSEYVEGGVYDITVGDEKQNILDYFLFSETMRNAYFYLALIGLILIVVFTIYKIIKQDYFDRAGPRSKGPIFRNVAISCVSFLLVIPIFYLIVHVSSLLCVSVMGAMGMDASQFAGAKIFCLSWSDGGEMMQVANQALAGSGQSKLNWMWDLDNDILFATMGKGKYVGMDDSIVERVGNGVMQASEIKGLGDLNIGEAGKITRQVDGEKLYGTFYWYIYLVGVIIAIKSLYKLILAMIQRIFKLMGLFLVAPSPISQYVLDDGTKYKEWMKQSIHEGLRLVVATMSFSIYLIALNLIKDINFVEAFQSAVDNAQKDALEADANVTISLLSSGAETTDSTLADKAMNAFYSLVNAFLKICMLMGAGGAITDLDETLTPLISGQKTSLGAGAVGSAVNAPVNAAVSLGTKAVGAAAGLATGAAKLVGGAVANGVGAAAGAAGAGIKGFVGGALSAGKKIDSPPPSGGGPNGGPPSAGGGDDAPAVGPGSGDPVSDEVKDTVDEVNDDLGAPVPREDNPTGGDSDNDDVDNEEISSITEKHNKRLALRAGALTVMGGIGKFGKGIGSGVGQFLGKAGGLVKDAVGSLGLGSFAADMLGVPPSMINDFGKARRGMDKAVGKFGTWRVNGKERTIADARRAVVAKAGASARKRGQAAGERSLDKKLNKDIQNSNIAYRHDKAIEAVETNTKALEDDSGIMTQLDDSIAKQETIKQQLTKTSVAAKDARGEADELGNAVMAKVAANPKGKAKQDLLKDYLSGNIDEKDSRITEADLNLWNGAGAAEAREANLKAIKLEDKENKLSARYDRQNKKSQKLSKQLNTKTDALNTSIAVANKTGGSYDKLLKAAGLQTESADSLRKSGKVNRATELLDRVAGANADLATVNNIDRNNIEEVKATELTPINNEISNIDNNIKSREKLINTNRARINKLQTGKPTKNSQSEIDQLNTEIATAEKEIETFGADKKKLINKKGRINRRYSTKFNPAVVKDFDNPDSLLEQLNSDGKSIHTSINNPNLSLAKVNDLKTNYDNLKNNPNASPKDIEIAKNDWLNLRRQVIVARGQNANITAQKQQVLKVKNSQLKHDQLQGNLGHYNNLFNTYMANTSKLTGDKYNDYISSLGEDDRNSLVQAGLVECKTLKNNKTRYIPKKGNMNDIYNKAKAHMDSRDVLAKQELHDFEANDMYYGDRGQQVLKDAAVRAGYTYTPKSTPKPSNDPVNVNNTGGVVDKALQDKITGGGPINITGGVNVNVNGNDLGNLGVDPNTINNTTNLNVDTPINNDIVNPLDNPTNIDALKQGDHRNEVLSQEALDELKNIKGDVDEIRKTVHKIDNKND